MGSPMLRRLDLRGHSGDLRAVLPRPDVAGDEPVAAVRDIIAAVADRGDAAVLDYTARFDGVELTTTRVDRAEAALRALGFDDVRVRHYDDTARIELPADRLADAAEVAAEIHEVVVGAGYRYATLDLAGLRSGNLNHAVGPTGGMRADGS